MDVCLSMQGKRETRLDMTKLYWCFILTNEWNHWLVVNQIKPHVIGGIADPVMCDLISAAGTTTEFCRIQHRHFFFSLVISTKTSSVSIPTYPHFIWKGAKRKFVNQIGGYFIGQFCINHFIWKKLLKTCAMIHKCI